MRDGKRRIETAGITKKKKGCSFFCFYSLVFLQHDLRPLNVREHARALSNSPQSA